MNEIIREGYAEKVPISDASTKTSWYIPHHGVYHPKKPNKLRVVVDCSAKFQDTCLNQLLLQGPDLANNLIGVLLRFRNESVAISCDIEKMFFQFSVNPEHRDLLRFVWWPNGDINSEPVDYRMTVHLFGAVSSPSVANFGLKQIGEEGSKTFGTAASDFVKDNFYVDDGLISVPSVEEAIDLVSKTRKLCANRGLHLHKFASNSQKVLDSIPSQELSDDLQKWQLDSVERALGIEWVIKDDCLRFKVAIKDRPPTRRGMLSMVHSLYDPLGLVSPITLIGRKILQEACKSGSDWDDPLPNALVQKWETFQTSVRNLERLMIPLCYKPDYFGKVVSTELHHFSDASIDGYGQCSYIRLLNDVGNVHCSLVFSKAKVTPLKQLTIPRLELNAAVLSTRVGKMLEENLQLADAKHSYYTDSRVVLGYISNDTKRFHTFVANRIQEIRDVSEPSQWFYVNTRENTADIASRGATAEQLMASEWFSGPRFLWEHPLRVNKVPAVELDQGDPEVRKTVASTKQETVNPIVNVISRCSNLSKVQSYIAIWLRYMDILKEKVRPRSADRKLDVSYQHEAMISMIRSTQMHYFKREMEHLRKEKSVTKGSLLYKLDPSIDSEGVLRVGGRVQNSELTENEKHPVILPKQAPLAQLVVDAAHKAVVHQG
jgi:hypothetical protein